MAGVTHKDLISTICDCTMPGFTYLTNTVTDTWDSEDSLVDALEPTDTFVSYANSSTRWSLIQWCLSWTKEKCRLEADGELHFINPTISGTTYDYEYSLAGNLTPEHPEGFAYDGTYLYVSYFTDPGIVLKINPVTMRLVSHWVSPANYGGMGLFYYDGYIYAVLEGSSAEYPAKVVKISTTSMLTELTYTDTDGDYDAYSITGDTSHVYVSYSSEPAKVLKLSMSSMEETDRWTGTTENYGYGITYDDGYVYLVIGETSTVIKITASTMEESTRWANATGDTSTDSICFDGTYLYINGYNTTNDVIKLDPADMTEVDRWVGDAQISGICYLDSYIYVLVIDSPAYLIKINPTDMSEVARWNSGLEAGGQVLPIITDGSYIYITLDVSPTQIVKINTSTMRTVTKYLGGSLPSISNHPFYSKISADPIIRPNIITVRNDAYDKAGAATDSSYLLTPFYREYIYPVADNAQAGAVADAVIQNAQLASQGNDVAFPVLNLGQELWDYVHITDSRENDKEYTFNVQKIEETWDAEKCQLTMVIRAGGQGNLPSGNAISQGRKILDQFAMKPENQPATIGELNYMGTAMATTMDEITTQLQELANKVSEIYVPTPDDTSGS